MINIKGGDALPRGEARQGLVTMRSRRIVNQGQPYHDYYKDVFRGYWEDDKCKRKDGEELKTFERVKYSKDLFGVFDENIVMVDVDDRMSAKVIKQILDDTSTKYLWQQTDRGMHFIFHKGKYSSYLKSKSHIKTALTLEVDYKVHSTDGTKLVKEGRQRELIGTGLSLLPYWLLPVQTKEDFRGLKDGDGRNSLLFNYILTLARNGLQREEIKQTIKLINQYVFEEKMSDNELKAVLRDEAFPTNNQIYIYNPDDPSSKKSCKLDFDMFSKHLVDVCTICSIEDLLYFYNQGMYVKATDRYLNDRIMDNLKNSTKQMRAEVKDYILKNAPLRQGQDKNLILFSNGIYDIKNRTLKRFDSDLVFFNKIQTRYIENPAKSQIVDKFLDDITCNDDDVKKLLIQMVGYCLLYTNPYQKFFYLDGNGRNGKSTLFDFITYCIGISNISNLSIQNLSDRFGVGSIRDKLINIGDDIPQGYIIDSSNLKKAVSGETILVEEKFKDKEPLNFQGKLIFSGNGIPRFEDKSDGLMRRIITIPMKAKFVDKVNRDVNFKDKLLTKENAEYFIYLCVEQLHEVLEHGFIEPQSVIAAKEEFKEDNDPVLQYLDENTVDGRQAMEVFNDYKVWCEECGYKYVGRNTFYQRCETVGYVKKQKHYNRHSKCARKEYVLVKENDKQGEF